MRIKNVNDSSRLSNFRNFFGVIQMIPVRLVTMDETSLYHYDPETKQQSMEWRHSDSPRPQIIPSAKIRWKSSRLDFGIKTASSSLIIFQRAKLSTRSIISAGAIEGHFEGKTPRKVTKGVLFLHDNVPAHRALATQKKLAYLGFQCVYHPPHSPDLAPSEYYVFPGLKKQFKGRHFLSDAEVIAAAETWLNGQPSEYFVEWLA